LAAALSSRLEANAMRDHRSALRIRPPGLRVERLLGAGMLVAVLAGCAGLNVQQEAGWVAFHDCQPAAPSAAMEDLSQNGRVNYRTREGSEFSVMKACMEQRGYRCDLGLTIGARPHTHCYPGSS
jgi:hypothetical protein